jgi:hypothetical protein
MTRIIRGYREGQHGGGCLVMLDDAVLPMPAIDPKREARHSPDGFQWGYAGSGPAELARAILVALHPDNPAVRHPACYQAFKVDVIARIAGDTLWLTGDQVATWLARWRSLHAATVATIEEARRLDVELARLETQERAGEGG